VDYVLNKPFGCLRKLVDDLTIKLSGKSGSDQVRFGVLIQNSRVRPDDLGLFLSELRFESREKVATLLELMPELK
jgi:hypothetical protein